MNAAGGPVLVCFAVQEEAAEFGKVSQGRRSVRILVTGMGRANAERSLRAELASKPPPRLVLTCGFAGGLDPSLAACAVVFDADDGFPMRAALEAAGAHIAKFHCAERIVVTASEKAALRQRTVTDAVEMESGIIRAVCRERGLPSATVRVISDAADEDLPLDFNALMTADRELRLGSLAWQLVKSPSKIGPLLALRNRSRAAARALSDVLLRSLRLDSERA